MRAAYAVAILLLILHATPAFAQAPHDILTYKGADRTRRLVEGARKEGQVVIYSALIVNQAMRPIAEKFGKKYPFVKLSYWRADSEDITAQVFLRLIRLASRFGLGTLQKMCQPFDIDT